jgi:hypothetical protein
MPLPYAAPQSVWFDLVMVAFVAQSSHTSFKYRSRSPNTIVSDAFSAPVMRFPGGDDGGALDAAVGRAGGAAPVLVPLPGSGRRTRDQTLIDIEHASGRVGVVVQAGVGEAEGHEELLGEEVVVFCARAAPYRADARRDRVPALAAAAAGLAGRDGVGVAARARRVALEDVVAHAEAEEGEVRRTFAGTSSSGFPLAFWMFWAIVPSISSCQSSS